MLVTELLGCIVTKLHRCMGGEGVPCQVSEAPSSKPRSTADIADSADEWLSVLASERVSVRAAAPAFLSDDKSSCHLLSLDKSCPELDKPCPEVKKVKIFYMSKRRQPRSGLSALGGNTQPLRAVNR
jgi:hypothetical protein